MQSNSPIPVGRYADIGAGARVHYHDMGDGEAVIFLASVPTGGR